MILVYEVIDFLFLKLTLFLKLVVFVCLYSRYLIFTQIFAYGKYAKTQTAEFTKSTLRNGNGFKQR